MNEATLDELVLNRMKHEGWSTARRIATQICVPVEVVEKSLARLADRSLALWVKSGDMKVYRLTLRGRKERG